MLSFCKNGGYEETDYYVALLMEGRVCDSLAFDKFKELLAQYSDKKYIPVAITEQYFDEFGFVQTEVTEYGFVHPHDVENVDFWEEVTA